MNTPTGKWVCTIPGFTTGEAMVLRGMRQGFADIYTIDATQDIPAGSTVGDVKVYESTFFAMSSIVLRKGIYSAEL